MLIYYVHMPVQIYYLSNFASCKGPISDFHYINRITIPCN